MNAYTQHHHETNDYKHGAEVTQAQPQAQGTVGLSLRYRLRHALSKRLITWGAQLYIPPR